MQYIKEIEWTKVQATKINYYEKTRWLNYNHMHFRHIQIKRLNHVKFYSNLNYGCDI